MDKKAIKSSIKFEFSSFNYSLFKNYLKHLLLLCCIMNTLLIKINFYNNICAKDKRSSNTILIRINRFALKLVIPVSKISFNYFIRLMDNLILTALLIQLLIARNAVKDEHHCIKY